MTISVVAPPRRKGEPEWPDGSLDARALAAAGWKPVPIRQFLFKVFTRCNLNCDYCYVYELADQSWRSKPGIMSPEVVAASAARIAEHAREHNLDEVRIILHGGEPLLAGANFLEHLTSTIASALPATCRASFGMQTNGVLVSDEVIELCARLQLCLGVSLDGDQAANDRHRLYRNGTSSYDQVVQAIERLRTSEHPELFTGILCTIDLANDPVATYEHLVSLGAPAIDFLLPHGNWTEPPPGWQGASATSHADWLIPIFDRWFGAPRREVRVRYFEEIMNLVLGGRSQVETIGITPATLVVIETSGAIEQVDSLKSAFEGAAETGLNVFDSSFDEALATPGMAARQIGSDALARECRDCSLGTICGGGYYPHRYRAGSGFLNPSVYCADLFKLISHIKARVHAGLVEKGRS